jgi:hypothetical protein
MNVLWQLFHFIFLLATNYFVLNITAVSPTLPYRAFNGYYLETGDFKSANITDLAGSQILTRE